MARLVATQYHLQSFTTQQAPAHARNHFVCSPGHKTALQLNPSKASRQDSIKPIVLKNLNNEIALFLSVPFQKSLDRPGPVIILQFLSMSPRDSLGPRPMSPCYKILSPDL